MRFVNRHQSFSRLEFHYESPINQKIDTTFANDTTLELHLERLLPLKADSCSEEFLSQGLLVNAFGVSWPQFTVHIDRTAYDDPCQIIDFPARLHTHPAWRFLSGYNAQDTLGVYTNQRFLAFLFFLVLILILVFLGVLGVLAAIFRF